MQDASTRIRDYMREHDLTQRQLADLANVGQSTVSRALSNKVLRRGAARKRLFICIGINESEVKAFVGSPKDRVLAAFEGIWDHTEQHADAIIGVIQALSGLRGVTPDKQEGEPR